VASTDPEAPHHAVLGTVDIGHLKAAALLTNGASRWVDRFAIGSWGDLMGVLKRADGPAALIGDVRRVEFGEGGGEQQPREKRHDDATAAVVSVPVDPQGG
jgi:hypothetical protein